MNSREFSEWSFNRTIRIDRVLPLAAGYEFESATEGLRELVDESTADELRKIFGFNYLEDEDDDELRRESILQYFYDHNMYGFVVFAETPVKRHAEDGKSSTYSWGHHWMKAFYVNDLDAELQQKLSAWRDEMDAVEKAEDKKRAAV